MGGFMFGEMFGMLEELAAFLATVLVSRHGASPLRKPDASIGMRYASDVRCPVMPLNRTVTSLAINPVRRRAGALHRLTTPSIARFIEAAGTCGKARRQYRRRLRT